jgi:hypothetical protein
MEGKLKKVGLFIIIAIFCILILFISLRRCQRNLEEFSDPTKAMERILE